MTSTPSARSRTSPKVLMVGVGSLIAAISTYLLNILAARTLSLTEATGFLTNLALLFFFYGIVVAVTTEFTRSVAASVQTGVAEGPPALPVTLGIAAAAGVVVLVTSPIWPRTGLSLTMTLLIAVGVMGYTVHSGICGVLSGAGRWGTMSMLVGSEGLGRVGFALVALAVGATSDRLLGAVIAAAFVWVAVVLASAPTRQALHVRLDGALRVQIPRFAAAFAAQGASVALTVSYPVLLKWTTAPAAYDTSAPLLLAISLTRAPLMIPLMAYQSMILAYFVRAPQRAGRGLIAVAGALLGVGLVGAALAWLIGPPILTWMVSPEYFVDGAMMAVLTVSAAGLAMVTVTGAVTQALALHKWFVGGWLTALAVSVLLLLVPGSLSERAAWSLAAGPVAGCLVHAWAILRFGRSGRSLKTAGDS